MTKNLKFLLSVFTALFLVGCATGGGYSGNPWANSSGSVTPAAESPRSLFDPAPIKTASVDRERISNGAAAAGRPPHAGTTDSAYVPPIAPATQNRIVKVGLLLPLSGNHEHLGQSMLNAAQMALFDMNDRGFQIVPRDTAGTASGARNAAQSLVAEDVDIILGPVFSDAVRAAKSVASSRSTPIIGFSTDWTLADYNTYIMGFLPFSQVTRVVNFAAQNGYTDIGAFSPDTPYGNAVLSSYRNEMSRLGLSGGKTVKYPASQSDFTTTLRSFTNFDSRSRQHSAALATAEQQLKQNPGNRDLQKQVRALKNSETAGSLPFQAVLLPIGGDTARSIGNMLSFYDMEPDKVKRLGTGLWDDSGLAAEPTLAGSWFAAPSPDLRADFERRYRSTYGLRPPRLSTLAYDAMALSVILGRNGLNQQGAPFYSRSYLSNPNGFSGIDGIFRFRPDGLVERGLAVLEYKGGTIEVISPAPRTFELWSGQ